jgi:acetyl esterase/lipase
MSLRAALISAALRRFEKPFLAREQEPQVLRAGFERRARLLFHAPRGTVFSDRPLAGTIPATRIAGPDAGVILYFHGGGYVFGSPRTHRAMVAALARRAGLSAVLPAYRLAPEHPFPAAFEDAGRAFAALLDEGWPPQRIVLAGDSAGGGLALALLGQLCRQGGPRPGCAFALGPLTDMTFSGPSFRDNAVRDPLLPAARSADVAAFYLQGTDPRDPRCSPLFGRFPAPPPVWLGVSGSEILRDDSTRFAEHLRRAGGRVTVVMPPDLPHVWPIFHNVLPEARATLDALADWIRREQAPSAGS